MNERKMQSIITQKFCIPKKHDITVPNIWGCGEWWEADLVSMTKSRFLHEFEIKTSRKDWRAELRAIEQKSDVGFKHKRSVMLSEQFSSKENSHHPNYFWVVAPRDIVRDEEIPEYAGLMEVYRFRKRWRISIKKNAPRLHNGKMDDRMIHTLMRSLHFKYWNTQKDVLNEQNS